MSLNAGVCLHKEAMSSCMLEDKSSSMFEDFLTFIRWPSRSFSADDVSILRSAKLSFWTVPVLALCRLRYSFYNVLIRILIELDATCIYVLNWWENLTGSMPIMLCYEPKQPALPTVSRSVHAQAIRVLIISMPIIPQISARIIESSPPYCNR